MLYPTHWNVSRLSLERFDELCASYLEIPCYAEVPRLLKNLKNQGHKIVILSNGSPFMINSAVNANNLQDLFDEITIS